MLEAEHLPVLLMCDFWGQGGRGQGAKHFETHSSPTTQARHQQSCRWLTVLGPDDRHDLPGVTATFHKGVRTTQGWIWSGHPPFLNVDVEQKCRWSRSETVQHGVACGNATDGTS